MNKAITDGIQFMPEPFANGLQNWSSENGRPSDATYDGASNATLVAADADFGTCLELQKTEATQKLRYTSETPILESTYIQVKLRVKVISGSLPSVRIAGWAGDSADQEVTGITTTAGNTQITGYGDIFEISAIIGPGARTGVDMVWGNTPVFGHFGLDLTGANGGIIRIEDITIEDVTSVFINKKINFVDVLDFGAVGDGVTDDAAAFEAADDAANGRDILVPLGTYYIGQTITMSNRVIFDGTLTMPKEARLELLKEYHYNSYLDAFEDEQMAFEKAVQALFQGNGHSTLDLMGRLINITNEIDVHDIVSGLNTSTRRLIIRNGTIDSGGASNWLDYVATESGTYNPSTEPLYLTNISNIATIEAGSLIEGPDVGREVYVRSVDTANNRIELSKPFYGGATSGSYTFTRFRYQLNFLNFTRIDKLVFEEVNFLTRSICSAILLPPDGNTLIIRDCFFTRPKDRAITSVGEGCQGLTIERNQFQSSEEGIQVPLRTTVAINTNSNDVKLRDNRASRFKHFFVTDSSNTLITGNHIFQGDSNATPDRTAGIVIGEAYNGTSITDNYIDNCYIEWTNEYDWNPEVIDSSFVGLTVRGNIFFVTSSNPWFNFISVKPYGPNQYLNGINISGNTFKASGTSIDFPVGIDESIAPINRDGTRELHMQHNSYDGVTNQVACPAVVQISRTSGATTWTEDVGNALPFGMRAKQVTSVATAGEVETNLGARVYDTPAVTTELGGNQTEIRLTWSTAVRGDVLCTVRADRLLVTQ